MLAKNPVFTAVAVITPALGIGVNVDRYLPGRQPLGHHLAIDGDHSAPYTIIGVARNSK